MMKPYDWQRVDADKLAANNWTGLLAIEPGGGKTLAACLAIKESGANTVLISAPQSTHGNAWLDTVRDQVDQDVRILGNKTKGQQAAITDLEWGAPGVYITSPQFAARKSTDTSMWAGDMLILDESHQVATAKTGGNKAFSGWTPHDSPLNQRFGSRLALSGTPMRQSFTNMWATMRFLWPELSKHGEIADDNYWSWCQDRMSSQEVYTSMKNRDGTTKKVKQFLAESEPGLLVSEMPCVVIHKRREGCCEYHPNGFLDTDAPQVLERIVTLAPKQKKAIKELEDHYMTYFEDNPFVVELSMIQKQRIRQVCLGVPTVEYYWGLNKDDEEVEKSRLEFEADCESPFLDELFSILEDLPNDETVFVTMESQRFARVVVDRLNEKGIKAAEYSGKSKVDLKRFGVDFQVLVGIASSVGSGTDGLQTVCNTEVVMETPVSITMESQVSARLDRLGGKQVQRYVIKDDAGWAEGRISDNLLKRMNVNASMRLERKEPDEQK